MTPEIANEDFLSVETTHGTELIPVCVSGIPAALNDGDSSGDSDALDDVREFVEGKPREVSLVRGKFFARLSASGYMDATDWAGPFDSEAEARDSLSEAYDVCGLCGEEMGDKEGTFCGSCEPGEDD